MKLYIYVLLLISTNVFAGDYTLYISSDESLKCEKYSLPIEPGKCKEGLGATMCSSTMVASDLKRYFDGEKTEIRILVASFTNGHITFCSNEAKQQVSNVIRKIKEEGNNVRGRHLDDFIKVNGL